MCATNCPVDINTGELVKRLRKENHSGLQNKLAKHLASNYGFYENLVKFSVRTGFFLNAILGKNFMKKLTGNLKKIIPAIPTWSNQMQRPGKKINSHR